MRTIVGRSRRLVIWVGQLEGQMYEKLLCTMAMLTKWVNTLEWAGFLTLQSPAHTLTSIMTELRIYQMFIREMMHNRGQECELQNKEPPIQVSSQSPTRRWSWVSSYYLALNILLVVKPLFFSEHFIAKRTRECENVPERHQASWLELESPCFGQKIVLLLVTTAAKWERGCLLKWFPLTLKMGKHNWYSPNMAMFSMALCRLFCMVLLRLWYF